MIEKRLKTISSSKENFDQAVPAYNEALKNSGFRQTLSYEPDDSRGREQIQRREVNEMRRREMEMTVLEEATDPDRTERKIPTQHGDQAGRMQENTNRESGHESVNGVQEDDFNQQNRQSKNKRNRQRKRRLIWFNPPYNQAVTTNIGKKFLELIDTHFGKERPDKLHKIFNRHTIKLSYSCGQNIKNIIKAHNSKILKQTRQQNTQTERQNMCNCQDKRTCPIPDKCRTKTVVYKATATTAANTKTYIGSTENSFKERYYGHKASMRDAKYRNSTTLSHYYWDCKDKGETPHIQWEILRTCKTYRPGTRKCDICLTEKMLILRERGPHSLNKRSELMYKCPHRSKWKLLNVK